MSRANGLDPSRTWSSVTLVLADDPIIRALNRAVFRIDAPTDVISLAYPPLPGDRGQHSADVVVNVQRAIDYAGEGCHRRGEHTSARRCWTGDSELGLYIAHGIDHLTGADDHAAAERRRMRARELRWLKKAAETGLLQGLTTPT